MIFPPSVRHLLVGCRNQVTTWPCGKIADDRRFEIGFWFHGWTLSNLGLGVKIVPHAEWPNAGHEPRPEAGATKVGRIRARCLTARFPNPPVRTVHATFTAHGSRDRDIYGDFHFARIPPSPWCTACAFSGYLCTVSLPSPSGPSPCMWLSHTPTTMPNLTACRASEI